MYHPPLPLEAEEDGEEPPYYPSDALRALESEANELWEVYRELYYGGDSVGSVYLWDHGSGGGRGGGGFAGCFAVKKRE
jgi:capping protein (actin filament) muscle Z-line, beta